MPKPYASFEVLDCAKKVSNFRSYRPVIQKVTVGMAISQNRREVSGVGSTPCLYVSARKLHRHLLTGKSVKCQAYEECRYMVMRLPKGDLRTIAINVMTVWRHMVDNLGKPLNGDSNLSGDVLEGFYIDIDGWWAGYTKPSLIVGYEVHQVGIRTRSISRPSYRMN